MGGASGSLNEWQSGTSSVLKHKVVLQGGLAELGQSFLVKMGQFVLGSLVHVEGEILPTEALIKSLHAIDRVGHFQKKRLVVGLVRFKSTRGKQQDLEGPF